MLEVNDGNVSEVMQSRVIKLVPEIKFGDLNQNQQALGMLAQLFSTLVAGDLSQLQKITFDSCDFSSISPELFSQSVIRLEECDLRGSDLSTIQIRAILDKIIQTKELKLQKLSIPSEKLSDIPGEIIMKATVKLEETAIYLAIKEEEWPELWSFMAGSPIMKLSNSSTAGSYLHVNARTALTRKISSLATPLGSISTNFMSRKASASAPTHSSWEKSWLIVKCHGERIKTLLPARRRS